MPKQKISPRLKQNVFERDNYTCRHCGDKQGPFHADHVYPESKGGETTLANLVTACETCNRRKHAKVGVWPLPVGFFGRMGLGWLDWALAVSILLMLIGIAVN